MVVSDNTNLFTCIQFVSYGNVMQWQLQGSIKFIQKSFFTATAWLIWMVQFNPCAIPICTSSWSSLYLYRYKGCLRKADCKGFWGWSKCRAGSASQFPFHFIPWQFLDFLFLLIFLTLSRFYSGDLLKLLSGRRVKSSQVEFSWRECVSLAWVGGWIAVAGKVNNTSFRGVKQEEGAKVFGTFWLFPQLFASQTVVRQSVKEREFEILMRKCCKEYGTLG